MNFKYLENLTKIVDGSLAFDGPEVGLRLRF